MEDAQDQRAAGASTTSAAWSARSTSTTCCARGWSDGAHRHLPTPPRRLPRRHPRARRAHPPGLLRRRRHAHRRPPVVRRRRPRTQGLPRPRRPRPDAAAPGRASRWPSSPRARAPIVERRARDLGMRACTGVERQARLRAAASPRRSGIGTGRRSPSWATTSPTCRAVAQVGLSVAPANAHAWVRERVHWRTVARGGEGAARELCDLMLAAQGKAEAALDDALRSQTPSAQLRRGAGAMSWRAVLTLVLLAGALLTGWSVLRQQSRQAAAWRRRRRARTTCCATSS